MKITYTPCVGLKNLRKRATLKEAFVAFYTEVNRRLEAGKPIGMSYLGGCWIQPSSESTPFSFSQCDP